MAYFKCGSGGGSSVTIDDVVYDGDLKLKKSKGDIPLDDIKGIFQRGCAVTYNDEVHILGGLGAPLRTMHCKLNGTSWDDVSTLPYSLQYGSAVVLDGEIHILGSSGNNTAHYKWNGTTWTSVSNLPYYFYNGSAVVLGGEIHILGSYNSSNGKYHYKWNGTSWKSVSTLPYYFINGSAVVLDGEIHILGSSYNTTTYTYHYKWDGSTWTNVSTLPYNFYEGSAVVLDNEIHLLSSSNANTSSSPYNYCYQLHYKWDGTSWEKLRKLPFCCNCGCATVLNNIIHIMGGCSDNYMYYYYQGQMAYKIDAPIYEIVS